MKHHVVLCALVLALTTAACGPTPETKNSASSEEASAGVAEVKSLSSRLLSAFKTQSKAGTSWSVIRAKLPGATSQDDYDSEKDSEDFVSASGFEFSSDDWYVIVSEDADKGLCFYDFYSTHDKASGNQSYISTNGTCIGL